MQSFNKGILMVGVALLLQGCQTTANENIAVTNTPEMSASDQMAVEMTTGSVKVYSLDEPLPPPPAFTDAGAGYSVRTPLIAGGSSDPNVMVFPLDGAPVPVFDGAVPPLMPPAAEVPYSSPFPASAAPFSAVTVNGAQIYFKHGSSRLSPADQSVLSGVATRGGFIEVEGHASTRAEANDPVEKRIVNLKMSMDRAFKVSSSLIRKGVPPEAIKTTVYGDARPAGSEETSRRVDVLTRP